MSPLATTIHLVSAQFSEKEQLLVERAEFSASAFRFPGGVCVVRLKNSLGELLLLPFQGQQVWSAVFYDRQLKMKTMVDQPLPNRDFLSSFGGFFQHCGATAMGGPGPQDTHPLHGELPNAVYDSAYLLLGEDEGGAFIGMGGTYRHSVAFNFNYLAQPLVKLYAGSAVFTISMTVKNLKNSPMPLMYLGHVNFRPLDHSRLVYSALNDARHMRVRSEVPSHIQVKPGYKEFIDELGFHPEKHLVLEPGLPYDPEVVFYVDYLADAQGWAHTLQIHPDGSADVMRHRPDQLDHGIRWISRTADQDALGFEAGTAEASGFTAEKKKGNLRWLDPGASFTCSLQTGALTAAEAQQEEELINRIVRAPGISSGF